MKCEKARAIVLNVSPEELTFAAREALCQHLDVCEGCRGIVMRAPDMDPSDPRAKAIDKLAEDDNMRRSGASRN